MQSKLLAQLTEDERKRWSEYLDGTSKNAAVEHLLCKLAEARQELDERYHWYCEQLYEANTAIISLGEDWPSHKARAAKAEAERDKFKSQLAEAEKRQRDEGMAALLAEGERDQIAGLLDPVIAEIERQRVAAEERREAWWEEKQAECSACDDTGILSTAPDDPISFCTDCSEGRQTKAMVESPILRKVLESLP